MRNRMKAQKASAATAKLAVLAALALGLFPGGANGDGTEIGNAFYRNEEAHFELTYPKAWNRADLDNGVRVVEKSAANPASVKVSTAPANVQNLAQLRAYAKAQSPALNWVDVTVNGRPAVQAIQGIAGTIHLLRQPGEVGTIQFNNSLDNDAAKKVRDTVSSVKFDQ